MPLHDDQEHPELINQYTSGTTLYALALEMTSRCSARQYRLPEAQSDLELALKLLQYHTRALPAQHARVRLALARILRARALEESLASPSLLQVHSDGRAPTGDRDGATMAMVALKRARELLLQCLTLSALDGAHQQAVMREALLELAATFIPASASLHQLDEQGGKAAAAAAVTSALKLAHSAATKAMLLQRSSHLLAPVAVAQLPEWSVIFAKGQEQSFGAGQVGGILNIYKK